jgi:imidazolonepropionase-like amidohydrolase
MFGGGRRGGGGRADDLDAIRQGLDTSRLFGRGVVLQKPVSAWLLPDAIAATGSMVFLSPRDRRPADPQDPDRTGSNLASAAILARAGVPVAVTCPVGMFGGAGVGTGGILGQDLNTPHIDAAFAVRGGLDNRKALRTITLDAAKMLGVERRIGSLEPGKDADVLILDGDPLHYATFVTTALVNGKVVYEKANEPLFRHITR